MNNPYDLLLANDLVVFNNKECTILDGFYMNRPLFRNDAYDLGDVENITAIYRMDPNRNFKLIWSSN